MPSHRGSMGRRGAIVDRLHPAIKSAKLLAHLAENPKCVESITTFKPRSAVRRLSR